MPICFGLSTLGSQTGSAVDIAQSDFLWDSTIAPPQTSPQAGSVSPFLIGLTLDKITSYDNKRPGKPLIALQDVDAGVGMGTLFDEEFLGAVLGKRLPKSRC
jgi:hypothetical protein